MDVMGFGFKFWWKKTQFVKLPNLFIYAKPNLTDFSLWGQVRFGTLEGSVHCYYYYYCYCYC